MGASILLSDQYLAPMVLPDISVISFFSLPQYGQAIILALPGIIPHKIVSFLQLQR
jgi:hypothetical protein